MANKKLIEVALPLEAINAESAREKSIRHGHPSTLHLWWARRPLAAARAVIWSSLVDDPSSHPEMFPTEAEQDQERQRLFKILSELVIWENSNNPEVLNLAKEEILKYTNNNPPKFVDPFSGGGAIPLEAQRLGLSSFAHDLNPVSVMINKAMIEIPPRFAEHPAVNPTSRTQHEFLPTTWLGNMGLATDIEYYGTKLKELAFSKLENLYPKVEVPHELGGGEANVIAWLWARTVKCPNPACGCELPLVKTFTASLKTGNEHYCEPIYENGKLRFEVKRGTTKRPGTVNRKGAICPCCGASASFSYIREEYINNHRGATMMAVIAEGNRKKYYITPKHEDILLAQTVDIPDNSNLGDLAFYPGYINPVAYGFTQIQSLFTNRQLTMLTTLSSLIEDIRKSVLSDAVKSGLKNDYIGLNAGGSEATAYSEAISVYLAFLVDKLVDYNSTISSWINNLEALRNTFGMTGMSMSWDYAEANPFSNSSGCLKNMLKWIVKVIQELPQASLGHADQVDAQSDDGMREMLISTDPPYYNNVPYADFADYFYVWMRKALKDIYPELFRTMLTPKVEELTADPYLRGGKYEAAKYFEEGMLEACKSMYCRASDDYPLTIYYAYKQNDSSPNGDESELASTGWETMLSAIISSGFSINGTWPVRTERAARTRSNEANALASSIVLVCRKRPENAPTTTRRNLINELKRELRPALQKLQRSNIAPVDLAQSAIGPGMGVYSKYKKVLESDGSAMTVRSALQIINQELDIYFNEQDGELDRDSRFCVDLYSQNAFNDIKFGDADTLARAKNTSVALLAGQGVLYAEKGVVHLKTRDEIPEKVDDHESNIWLLTQQLTRAMEEGGVKACAEIVAPMFGSNAEHAKDLAYRLFTIAEKKGWAQEAYAYNSLVIAWPDIQSAAAQIQAIEPEQISLF